MCEVARLPVREVLSASHFVADLTLGLGAVVFDYLDCIQTNASSCLKPAA
jgi:acetoacetate decarboxylase